MWDLAEDRDSAHLIESLLAANKPVALVCNGPVALRHVKTPEGRLLLEGMKVNAFKNTEEAAVSLAKVVPFMLEDDLKVKGGIYSSRPDWSPMWCRMAW